MIQALASWRFIFALMIFMHHFYMGNQSLFSEGYLGVFFFFILSGFVLSYRYGNNSTTWGRFILKRISKLYPMHILCLCLFLLMGSRFSYLNFSVFLLFIQCCIMVFVWWILFLCMFSFYWILFTPYYVKKTTSRNVDDNCIHNIIWDVDAR